MLPLPTALPLPVLLMLTRPRYLLRVKWWHDTHLPTPNQRSELLERVLTLPPEWDVDEVRMTALSIFDRLDPPRLTQPAWYMAARRGDEALAVEFLRRGDRQFYTSKREDAWRLLAREAPEAATWTLRDWLRRAWRGELAQLAPLARSSLCTPGDDSRSEGSPPAHLLPEDTSTRRHSV